MWGCASVEYCQARREMLSGSKTYIYAPWLAEQDCGFVFSPYKAIANCINVFFFAVVILFSGWAKVAIVHDKY
jgi:hypothetical protein